jgi:hypothetical protein
MPCSGGLSASRAYYAMYQEAQCALEAVGLVRTEWTHGGLQATHALGRAREFVRQIKEHSHG